MTQKQAKKTEENPCWQRKNQNFLLLAFFLTDIYSLDKNCSSISKRTGQWKKLQTDTWR